MFYFIFHLLTYVMRMAVLIKKKYIKNEAPQKISNFFNVIKLERENNHIFNYALLYFYLLAYVLIMMVLINNDYQERRTTKYRKILLVDIIKQEKN